MSSTITIKGSSREFLEECLKNGWLEGEAAKRADQVLAESAALRRENALLRGRLAEQRKVNKDYRRAFADALNYQYDAEEGWRYSASHRRQMMFAAVGLTAAVTCLLCALAMWL